MNRTLVPAVALLGGLLCLPPPSVGASRTRAAASARAVTPPPGSPVRAAIMDALRGHVKGLLGAAYPGAASVRRQQRPGARGLGLRLGAPPREIRAGDYEPLNELLRRTGGRWRVIGGPDFEMGSEQGLSDAQILRRFRRRHPEAPADLF